MATMGVRWVGGGGSSSGGLGDAMAKAFQAYYGNADDEIALAKARSQLENDQYQRTLTEASTAWTRTREQADAAALQAKLLGQQDIQNNILRFLNQSGAAGGAEAPAPVEYTDLPADVPTPTDRPDYPVPVDLGFSENQSAFPARPAGPQLPMPAEQDPRMVAITGRPDLQTEPDYGFSTYPVESEMLPGTASVPTPAPVRGTAIDPMDAAAIQMRPPDELSPLGQAMPTSLPTDLTGLPEELQPVPVPDAGFQGPPQPEGYRGGVQMTVPGRVSSEAPVPLDPLVSAGPPESYEAPQPAPQPAPEAPVPVEDLAVPGEPIQGPPVPPEASPAGPPTATGDIYPEGQLPPQTQQLMPGEVEPQPDGSVAVGTKGGTRVFTADDVDGIAALIAFSNDPAGQFGGFSGRLDMMNRGAPTALNTSLVSGQAPARSSTLGTDEEIRLQTEVEKVKAGLVPPDLKKNIITEGGRTEELYVDPADQRIKVRPVQGGQPADNFGGTSDNQVFLKTIRDVGLAMADPAAAISPTQASEYELAYREKQKVTYDWQDVAPSEEYPNGGKARVPVPPMDLSNYPTPDQVRARAGLPAGAAPAPAAPAPVVTPNQPDVAAPAPSGPVPPAVPGTVPPAGTALPTVPAEPVPAAQAAPAPAAPTEGGPTGAPFNPADPKSGPRVGIQPTGQVVGTGGGIIVLPKGPKDRSEFQSRSWLWLREAAHADMMMKTQDPPDWLQRWMVDPQRDDPSVFNALMQEYAVKDETWQFAASSAGFVNSEGRINSGATIMNPENINFGYRFIPRGSDSDQSKLLKDDNRKVALDSIYDVLSTTGLMTPQMEAELKSFGYERNAPLPSMQAQQPVVEDYDPSKHGGGM